jgi:AraC-like DNA-binding protein
MTDQMLEVPSLPQLPRPVYARAQQLPPRHGFPEHQHAWNQLAYATSGVLHIAAGSRCFAVSPAQAVWLPQGLAHRVSTQFGATFRSIYIDQASAAALPAHCVVVEVRPLLRELIVEIHALAALPAEPAYEQRLAAMLVEQLGRARPVPFSLPWPNSAALKTICASLYADPADTRGMQDWAGACGMSARTLARKFEHELGMNFRSWQRAMRLFRAMELLGSGRNVTATALELGYGSSAAFIYMFHQATGRSPKAHQQAQAAG